jgi:hypothetical protein
MRSIDRQASLYGMGLRQPTAAPAEAEPERTCRLLLDACLLARQQGGGAVVWPVNAGETLDLDRIAATVDRALLAARLVSVGDDRPVEVRTPYADFTDRHLADLILDMDLPIWTCWWYDAQGDAAAERERRRWGDLLRAAGWRGELPTPDLAARAPRAKPARQVPAPPASLAG